MYIRTNLGSLMLKIKDHNNVVQEINSLRHKFH